MTIKQIELQSPLREIRIHWVDSTGYSGWNHRSDLLDVLGKGLETIETIGWLLYDCEEFVAVSGTASKSGVYDLLMIPRVAIIDMFYLSDNATPVGADH